MTAPVAALAVRLGMDIVRDRGRFVPEIIRLVYTPPLHRQPTLSLTGAPSTAADVPSPVVPLPLSVRIWSESVFKRSVPPEDLLAAILTDRRAALLCRGLAGLDDETLTFYAEHPQLLAFLYARGAPAFAAFGASVRVRDGRITVPGGVVAERLWEAVALAPVSTPDAFVRALFAEPGGRLAYLYDVLAAATPVARTFALGTWMSDEPMRLQRFQALAAGIRGAYHEWNVDELPFARPLNDLAMLLLRVRVSDAGSPGNPASRPFWRKALGTRVTDADPPAESSLPIDAAWLVRATSGGMFDRGDRLDQLAFGQRAFGTLAEPQSDDVAAIVSELPQRRMLLLTLERLGVTHPSTYRAALRQARDVDTRDGAGFWTMAQFQGAIALVDRMRRVGMLDPSAAVALLDGLFDLRLRSGAFHGALASWVEHALVPRLPPGPSREQRLTAAVAGTTGPRRLVEWEGETYRLDLPFAERRRIERTRDKQGSVDLDQAIGLWSLASDVTQVASAEAIRSQVSRVDQWLQASDGGVARSSADLAPPAVPLPPDGRTVLTHAVEELERAARAGDLRRARRAGDAMVELADVALGQALVSFVYAMNLGDPDGPALLGANVALRHDFGFGRRDGTARARTPWALPHQDFRPGIPWHVTGSLLGLDLALAPLGLRRLAMDVPENPPRVPSLEREGFAANVAMLDSRRLADGDRDRIGMAIARGRARIAQLLTNPALLGPIADDLSLDGWQERAVRWTLQNEPDWVENHFSLADLFLLGGGSLTLDAWGTSAHVTQGCLCTRFPGPGLWRMLAGRPQAPMLAAAMVDMNLELARRFAEMRLPASLLPAVLTTAVQDFLDRAEPADPNDIAALARYIRAIPPHAIEDYVAAAATLDGPLVVDDAEASREH